MRLDGEKCTLVTSTRIPDSNLVILVAAVSVLMPTSTPVIPFFLMDVGVLEQHGSSHTCEYSSSMKQGVPIQLLFLQAWLPATLIR